MMIAKRIWLLAILLAVTFHVSAFMLIQQNKQEEDGAKDIGAQGIEINLGMMGDLGERKVSKQARQEPTPVTELEPEPEVIEKPKPKPKPKQVRKEKVPEIKQETAIRVKKTAVEQTNIIETKTLKPVEKPTETKPVKIAQAEDTGKDTSTERKQTTGAANALMSGGSRAAQQSYFGVLASMLAKQKRYPISSKRRGQEGIVKLFFEIDKQGKVLSYRIAQSSGFTKLDDEVLRMLKKAQPFPAFPAEMIQQSLSISVPIAFKLN